MLNPKSNSSGEGSLNLGALLKEKPDVDDKGSRIGTPLLVKRLVLIVVLPVNLAWLRVRGLEPVRVCADELEVPDGNDPGTSGVDCSSALRF